MKRLILAITAAMLWQSVAMAKPTFVSKDDYVVGGLVGSIVGFGIGHAVQSRYKSFGWAFTVGETAGLIAAKGIPAAMVATKGHAKNYISLAGWSVFVGFRLWQIIDLWVNTKPERAISASIMNERPWQNGWWGAQQEAQGASAVLVPVFSF